MKLSTKILLGFTVVAFILLLSGLISIFELGRMKNSLSTVLTNNVANINSTRDLIDLTDEQVYNLLSQIGIEKGVQLETKNLYDDSRFIKYINNSRELFTNKHEKALADTILYAYAAYVQVLSQAKEVWSTKQYTERKDWYMNSLYPNYQRLRGYIKSLINLEQKYLERNTENIKGGFHRSIMPSVTAVSAGILLVFLFYFFIDLYIVKPINKITNSIKAYTHNKQKYEVKIETDDEMRDLSDSISNLIQEHRIYSKGKRKVWRVQGNDVILVDQDPTEEQKEADITEKAEDKTL